MSDPELPPAELEDLFAAERAAPPANAATRSAVRSRLAATVAHVPLGHAGTALGAVKVLAIIAVTVGAGLGTVAMVKRSQQRPSVPSRDLPSEAVKPAVTHDAQVETPPIATPTVKPLVVTTAKAPTRPSEPESEAELLRRAWTAQSSGKPDVALEMAERDAQLHPNGALAEERDAVRIAALASLNRIAEARSAATAFLQRYPSSVHRALVERSINEAETP